MVPEGVVVEKKILLSLNFSRHSNFFMKIVLFIIFFFRLSNNGETQDKIKTKCIRHCLAVILALDTDLLSL